MKIVMASETEEKFRGPVPLGENKFPEENFFDFTVIEGKQQYKLNTYRYNPPEKVEPKCIFVVFHGMNSHINNFAHVAKELA